LIHAVACDAPVIFAEEQEQLDQQPNNVILSVADEDVRESAIIIVENASASTDSGVTVFLPLISLIIVGIMSIACVVRICCIRCCSRSSNDAPVDDEMWVMAGDVDDVEQGTQPELYPVTPMQSHPIMTADGVQYIMLPQEVVLAQQQQLLQQQQQHASLYPGFVFAQPQQQQQ
jgi:hypothetical protein